MIYTFTTNDFWLMAQGAGITFVLTIVSGAIGTLIGFFVGWARTARSRIVFYLLGAYIDVIRSVPLIIQFVLFNSFMAIAGYPMNPFFSGIITLSIYISGYVAEVVKAGIESVPAVTRKAARGLGLTYLQDFLYIVVPIGMRTIFPAWTGLMLGLMKDTSLIAVLGATPPELLRASQIIINRIQEPLMILLGAGAFYFVMCYVITVAAGRYERSWQEKRKAA
ncbi:MAG: ABC transporter permease subunit [Rhizobiales bacterium]|nr:ABC transporter permease subunit [Hyphomicrobiales bacterium]